ncbi:hypothetical protein SDC9_133792 [bioreactor metagenome]|uniref:Uncharacterized protein n=1 Tax=bioreactor metagenome TaxID=1076179 RepID=A0A645DBL0_9ZZZZ
MKKIIKAIIVTFVVLLLFFTAILIGITVNSVKKISSNNIEGFFDKINIKDTALPSLSHSGTIYYSQRLFGDKINWIYTYGQLSSKELKRICNMYPIQSGVKAHVYGLSVLHDVAIPQAILEQLQIEKEGYAYYWRRQSTEQYTQFIKYEISVRNWQGFVDIKLPSGNYIVIFINTERY